MYSYEEHLKNVQTIAKDFGIPAVSEKDSLADITTAMYDRISKPLDDTAAPVSDNDDEWNMHQKNIDQELKEIDDFFAEMGL